MDDGPHPVRVALAYAFPERDAWANALVAAAPRGALAERWLLTAATDLDALLVLARRLDPEDVLHREGDPPLDVPLSTLAAAGPRASSLLGVLLDAAGWGPEPRTRRAIHAILQAHEAVSEPWPHWSSVDGSDPDRADGYARLVTHRAAVTPRRLLAGLPARWETDPFRRHVVRDLCARLDPHDPGFASLDPERRERVAQAFEAVAEPPSLDPDRTGLAGALRFGDGPAIVEALRTATDEELVATEALWTIPRLMGVAREHPEAVELLADRAPLYAAVRVAADMLSLALAEDRRALALLAESLEADPRPVVATRVVDAMAAAWELRATDDAWQAYLAGADADEIQRVRGGLIAVADDIQQDPGPLLDALGLEPWDGEEEVEPLH
ncbi:MAG: hypothetical protein H6734_19700 [Alphaproteobacteria bacterium]|nr:hypothetical protein [Alphaproteobacteria bacterium]